MCQVHREIGSVPLERAKCVYVHAHPLVITMLPSSLPVASDAHYPGNRWLPGETAWRPQRQVHPPAHAGSSGDWAMSQGQGQVYCKPFLSLPYSLALVFHKNPSSNFLLSPASSVQVGPPTGKAAGSAHTDEGRHHAGPVALHQTQPAAGRA